MEFVTFSATAGDLRELLLRVEAGTPVYYARLGAYSTAEPPIHRGASEIPNLGERGQSKFIDPVFFLLPPGSVPACSPIKLARGGPWFCADQGEEPDRSFAVLRHCVLTESGQLEEGHISNRDDPGPDPLFRAVKKEIKRSFVVVRKKYIGPEALRQLQAGTIFFAEEEKRDKCSTLHPCILGRAVYQGERINPLWRTSEVVRLVGQVQASAEFSILPVLADALEEAGCTDREILDHCRMAGKHVAGCWAVELLAGNDPPGRPGRKSGKKR